MLELPRYIHIGLFQTVICTFICTHVLVYYLPALLLSSLYLFIRSFVTLSAVSLSFAYFFCLSLTVFDSHSLLFLIRDHMNISWVNTCILSIIDERYFILKTILLV